MEQSKQAVTFNFYLIFKLTTYKKKAYKFQKQTLMILIIMNSQINELSQEEIVNKNEEKDL